MTVKETMVNKIQKILKPECYGVGIKEYPCPVPDWGECRDCRDKAAQILSQIVEEIGKVEMTEEEIRGIFEKHSDPVIRAKLVVQAYRQKIVNKLEE